MADIKLPVKTIDGKIRPDNNVEALLAKQLDTIEKQLKTTEQQNKEISNLISRVGDLRNRNTGSLSVQSQTEEQIKQLQLEKERIALETAKLNFQEREKLINKQTSSRDYKKNASFGKVTSQTLQDKDYGAYAATGLSFATGGAINPVIIQKILPLFIKAVGSLVRGVGKAFTWNGLFGSSLNATASAVDLYKENQLNSRLDIIIDELRGNKNEKGTTKEKKKKGFFDSILESLGGLVSLVGKGILTVLAGAGAKALLDSYLKKNKLAGKTAEWLEKILPWAVGGYVAGGAKGAIIGAGLGYVNANIDKLFAEIEADQKILNPEGKEDLGEGTISTWIKDNLGLQDLTEQKNVLKGAVFGLTLGGAKGAFIGAGLALAYTLIKRFRKDSKEANKNADKKVTLKDRIFQYIDSNKQETALLAACLGFQFGGIKGALIGYASVGIASTVNTLIEKYRQEGISGLARELKTLSGDAATKFKNASLMEKLTLLGTIGYTFGGVKGALIGGTIALGYEAFTKLKKEWDSVDFKEDGSIDWVKNAETILGTATAGAIAGAALGWKATRTLKGALIGGAIGFAGGGLVAAWNKVLAYFDEKYAKTDTQVKATKNATIIEYTQGEGTDDVRRFRDIQGYTGERAFKVHSKLENDGTTKWANVVFDLNKNNDLEDDPEFEFSSENTLEEVLNNPKLLIKHAMHNIKKEINEGKVQSPDLVGQIFDGPYKSEHFSKQEFENAETFLDERPHVETDTSLLTNRDNSDLNKNETEIVVQTLNDVKTELQVGNELQIENNKNSEEIKNSTKKAADNQKNESLSNFITVVNNEGSSPFGGVDSLGY